MKNFCTIIALSSLFAITNVQADSYIIDDSSMTLIGETYDSEALIRHFQYDNDERTYYEFLEVPSSIQEKVNKDDPEAVKKVTQLLADYYKEVGNLPKLNELFLMYTPYNPQTKVTVSEEYSKVAADNLAASIDYLETNTSKDVPKNEISIMKATFGTEEEIDSLPYKTETKLFEATEDLIKELDSKWYENKLVLTIFGVIFLLTTSIILLRR